tara:strand:- start:932 stop:1105 length:174 start_codon:yes stop_codon:yes gene_type:complete
MLYNKMFQKNGMIITGIVTLLGSYYLYSKYKNSVEKTNNDNTIESELDTSCNEKSEL